MQVDSLNSALEYAMTLVVKLKFDNLEGWLIRNAFGAYVVTFLAIMIYSILKSNNIPILEFGSHTVLIALVAKLFKLKDQIPENFPVKTELSEYITELSIMAFVVASFLLGYHFGRTSDNKSASPPPKVERKFVLKPKSKSEITGENETIVMPSLDIDSTVQIDQQETEKLSPATIITIEQAQSVLLCIIDLKGTTTTNEYLKRQWSLVRSGSASHLWTSRSQSDGILLRGSSITNVSVQMVLKWLVDHDCVTTIEGIIHRTEVLKSCKSTNGIASLRRLVCKSGSLTSSKRDFMVINCVSGLQPDGSYIISSRSVDHDLSTQDRKKDNGCVRGKIFTSGYVIRPRVFNGDIVGSEILFAAHLDLMGAFKTSRTNLSKTDVLIGAILTTMDRIQQECSETRGKRTASMDRDLSVMVASNKTTTGSSNNNNTSLGSPLPSTSGAGSMMSPMSSPYQPASSGGGAVRPGPDSPHHMIDLTAGQKDELLSVAQEAIRKLRHLHTSFNSQFDVMRGDQCDSNIESTRNRNRWETFYDSDGICVRELNDNASPIGILNSSCTTEAPPHVVRQLLLEHPDAADSLLEGRSLLSRVDAQTYVQWLAYGAIWPVGARDFLLVTTEQPYNTQTGEGFIIVSTSIDHICEMNEEDQENRTSEDDSSSGYTRSCMRLAGYVGVPNKNGGTDLSLFVDVDVYSYIPAWLLQVLAQYGLSEIMCRIRRATKGQPEMQQPYELSRILNQIQSREAKMRQFVEENKLSAPAPSMSSPLQRRLSSSTSLTLTESLDAAAAEGGNASRKALPRPSVQGQAGQGQGQTQPASDNSGNIANIDVEMPMGSVGGAVTVTAGGAGSQHSTVCGPLKLPPHNNAFAVEGQQLAAESLRILRVYLGLEKQTDGLPPLNLDWQVKTSKKNVTVSTSMVNGSVWGAIRANAVLQADKAAILKVLLDDKRINEYDDMFDTWKFITSVDDHTNVRRMLFKAIWPTAPRDFVACTTWTDLEDGSIMVATRSAPDDICPQHKDFVRGFIQLSGYWIQPSESLNNDPLVPPGTCKITLTVHSELGGTLPASVINMLATAAPLKLLSALDEIVKR